MRTQGIPRGQDISCRETSMVASFINSKDFYSKFQEVICFRIAYFSLQNLPLLILSTPSILSLREYLQVIKLLFQHFVLRDGWIPIRYVVSNILQKSRQWAQLLLITVTVEPHRQRQSPTHACVQCQQHALLTKNDKSGNKNVLSYLYFIFKSLKLNYFQQ